jgi:hypothetical protein
VEFDLLQPSAGDAMKERPILFSGAMVRAILDGSKTQTRRVCKPAQTEGLSCVVGIQDPRDFGQRPLEVPGSGWFGDEEGDVQFLCPYGRPGDRLWVREAVADIGCRLTYRADTDDGAHCKVTRWTPSIHMPRAASRILLEIVSVRVERLNDCSEADAIAEGVRPEQGLLGDDDLMVYAIMTVLDVSAPVARYILLWDSINSTPPNNWNSNPYVWVVEFKRVML